jgi:hypothetical protein
MDVVDDMDVVENARQGRRVLRVQAVEGIRDDITKAAIGPCL